MDFTNMKALIKKNIVDFSELVLDNYNRIGLDEVDAIIIIKLHKLLNKGITFISSQKLSEGLSISHRTTAKRLNSLIERSYIAIELIKGNNGKETERFNLDYIIQKILLEQHVDRTNQHHVEDTTIEAKVVDLFETELNKQLSVLEIQTITKWLQEDKYTYEQIQDALFDAVKVRKTSIKYIDRLLLNEDKLDYGQQMKRKAAINDLRKIWEE